jgi:hypothetical protein
MTDTPQDAFTLNSAEATLKLNEMAAAFRGAPPSDKPTTPAQAQARLSVLTADKAWADRLAKSDVAVRREFTELTAQVANSTEALGGTELEVVDSISDPNAMTRDRYDGLLEGLRESGMPESGEKYVRDLDAGTRTDRPTAGDGAAAQAAVNRLTKDPEWAKKVLAGDMAANALRTRLGNVIALAGDDGKAVTPEVSKWLAGLG